MLFYAFLLILLLRPSWGLLGFFTLVVAVLWAATGYGAVSGDIVVLAIAVAIQTAIFYALGALIVFLRLRLGKGQSSKDKEIDVELARIRAEASARENRQPPQS